MCVIKDDSVLMLRVVLFFYSTAEIPGTDSDEIIFWGKRDMNELRYEHTGAGTFLTYELSQEDKLDNMSIGMLNYNKMDGILPIQYRQMDEVRQLVINITGMVSASQLMKSQVNKRIIVGIMTGIANALRSAEEYMLLPGSLLLGLDYIFIDAKTGHASVICLPLENLAQESPNLLSVLRDLVYHVTIDQRENSNYMLDLLNFVNSSTAVSLSDLLALLAKIDPVPTEHSTQSTSGTVVPNLPPVAPPVIPPVEPPIQPLPDPDFSTDDLFPEQEASDEDNISLYELLSAFNMDRYKKYKEQQKRKKNQKKDKKSKKNAAPGKEMDLEYDFVIPGQVESINTPSQKPVPQEKKIEQPIEHIDYGETEILTKTSVSTGQPYLIRKKTGERVFIHDTPFLIGKKRASVNFCIDDNATVSRIHAQITCKNGEFFVTDLESTNYTYVNGHQIPAKEPTVLAHGTVIGFSDEDFEFNML